MFQSTDAAMPPANIPPVKSHQTTQPDPLRLTAAGSPWAVQNFIQSMHSFGYADPNDWSKPIPTDQPGQVMVVLIKKIRREGV